ncbi:DUF1450 domain-containing protein [Tumebacillus flagellatus]|uniref:UDP-N-acetylmuramoylalanine--D-glutamate ligase n=1 Tax=Tumebacillus flagellatus TaxID=1157490 RepID=A0A074LQI4_9BACL|nr:DUF1450 domain-containing protein [Tumebacillus flagellatus]KEO84406.1 hypothetical protein EL26_04705 [Tumebacillus flagellatus]
MGIVIVEVCDVNPASALDLEQLEEDNPGVSAIRTPCLSNCTMCASTPYAYVNGELIAHEDRETLWTMIKAAVEQELQAWNSEL